MQKREAFSIFVSFLLTVLGALLFQIGINGGGLLSVGSGILAFLVGMKTIITYSDKR